jgi:hypothetical protein
MEHLVSVSKLVLGLLPVRALKMAVSIVGFERLFEQDGPGLLVDEDVAVFYFLSSTSTNPKARKVVWPHISLRAAAKLWRGTLREHDFHFPSKNEDIISAFPPPVLGRPSIAIEGWFNGESPPRPGTYVNLASVPPQFVIVYILTHQTDQTFRYFEKQFRWMFTFMGLQVPRPEDHIVHFVNPSTRFIAGYDVSILYMPDLGPFESDFSLLLRDILEIWPTPALLINAQAILAITRRYPQFWTEIFRDSVAPDFQECGDCQDGEVIWQEPSPTLLPHRRDLFKWTLNDEGQDSVLSSIKFSGGIHQKWRALMEWRGGRVIARAICESPIAVFNFEFCNTHGTKFEGKSNIVDNFVRLRHIALCLLSLMCEAVSGVRCPECILPVR